MTTAMYGHANAVTDSKCKKIVNTCVFEIEYNLHGVTHISVSVDRVVLYSAQDVHAKLRAAERRWEDASVSSAETALCVTADAV
jgi:hypothetical protein